MRSDHGSILPLALIMTTMILLAGIGIGTVVLQGSKRAVENDHSVLAYYFADSGIERQLYEVRKKDATTGQLSALDAQYPGQGSWTFFGGYATTTEKTFSTVATSSFGVVDLFNPDNVQAAGVARLDLSWSNGPDCAALGTSAQVEAGYADFDLTSGVLPQAYTVCRQGLSPPDANCVNSGQTMTLLLDPSKNYRVRIHALGCTAKDLIAKTYSDSGGSIPKAFPGDVTLSAEGTYQNATQKIRVVMPKSNVLSGVFSYVIFSECTLIKGTGTPTCP